jgi:ribose transport system ATP-binding protein
MTEAGHPRDDGGPILRVSGLSKSFTGTQALREVNLEVRRGEIHGLVGANGSGKSTLVKILAGIYRADQGQVEIAGRAFSGGLTPAGVRAAGLHFVHQDLGLFPDLSIADNLAIGRGYETDLAGRIRWRAVRSRTAEVLARFHITASPDTPVGALRPSARTMVAIARALQDQEGQSSGVLVLDEPTTSLPAADAQLLLDALRRYAAAGQSMLFISHDIDEVRAFAHRVSVLRDGRKVGTLDAAGLSHDEVVELITGRSAAQLYPDIPPPAASTALLSVQNLSIGPVRDLTFEVAAGEVVALAGLLGSGASEVLRAIFGALVPAAGAITLAGQQLGAGHTWQAIASGVAYVPGERAQAGFLTDSVQENLSAAEVARYWRNGVMQAARERRDAAQAMRSFGVIAASPAQPLAALSGGNQQKVLLARWLRREPRLLLLEEPTQGVDVGARADIYALIRSAAERGSAVLLVTVDFEEIAGLCDRALVISDGAIIAELRGPGIDHTALTELAMSGTMADPARALGAASGSPVKGPAS